MTTVSVVLPTYNRAAWLPQTVESILQQTHAPTEVIIVDDGSHDETEAVCAGFPDPVRYLRQENAGVSAARNRAIREAQGDWIALADSDDIWRPEKLEVQLAAMSVNPQAGWCASGCQVIDLESRPLSGLQSFERVFSVFAETPDSPDLFFARWLERGEIDVRGESHRLYAGNFFELLFNGNVVLPSSALIRRHLFDRVGLFDEAFRVAEETEFFHRAAAASQGVMVMTPLVGYRVAQQGSLTNSANTPRLIHNALTSLNRAAAARERLSPSEREAFEQGRRRLLFRLAYAELSLLNRAAAREAVVSSWRAGADRTPRSLAIYAASLLPVPVLRGLHSVKRGLAAVWG